MVQCVRVSPDNIPNFSGQFVVQGVVFSLLYAVFPTKTINSTFRSALITRLDPTLREES